MAVLGLGGNWLRISRLGEDICGSFRAGGEDIWARSGYLHGISRFGSELIEDI